MVRFGIVGTNWITEKFLDGASLVEDFTLNAVYSRTNDKAVEFAERYGVENTFTDLESMAKSDLIDAVYIASPNSLHAEQAQIFLRNKKHVLCEKPIASNSHELKQMIQTAKENNVLLMEAMKSTFLPNFQSVQENLHKIGTVRKFFANYCQYSSRYDAYKEGKVLNAFKPEFSNGALMDIGIYCIYPLVVLYGKPSRVQANGFLLDTGVDGEGSVLLTYEGMEATVMYSKITDSTLPSELQGEDGNIRIDRISTQEKVEIHRRDGSIEDITVQQVSNGMYYEAKEFADLIQAGKIESDKNTFSNSMIVMEILDEVRKQIGVVYPGDPK
ncbi:Gfo/Idh/MocA family oxidoreductase [Bacillus sp. CECT 9360]|uniref:Gfo/Idh/MocA family protein n=1 Tax=Bacillus sp. CECT 9360 TaxID=2845821 RepID=UPI001E538AE5|nr:Gfo/Idh/MocA family oxidoreductase [Bacillus sp. CECT 9360]CAH0344532.1 scyllo-inositol 2-dehydrogenase (NADP(+)) IolU [Bacillus sp. CECT 9360]